MILISACLVGINCRYNGGNCFNEKAFNLIKEGKAIPVCPEQLGGLPTPRNPAEIKIINNKKVVVDNYDNDVTKQFEEGAFEVIRFAKKLNINKIVLKSISPSCGVGKIYNGKFNGILTTGNGILTDLCLKNEIEVVNIEDL